MRIQVRAATVHALKDGGAKFAAKVEVAVHTESHGRVIIRCLREN